MLVLEVAIGVALGLYLVPVLPALIAWTSRVIGALLLLALLVLAVVWVKESTDTVGFVAFLALLTTCAGILLSAADAHYSVTKDT